MMEVIVVLLILLVLIQLFMVGANLRVMVMDLRAIRQQLDTLAIQSESNDDE